MPTVEIFLPFKIVTKSNVVYKNTVSFGDDNYFDAILNASFLASGGNYANSSFQFPIKNSTSNINTSDITEFVTMLKNVTTYTADFKIRNPIQISGASTSAVDISSYNGYFNLAYIANTSDAIASTAYASGTNVSNVSDAVVPNWHNFTGKSFESIRNNAIAKTLLGNFTRATSYTFNTSASTDDVSQYFLTNELNITATSIGGKLLDIIKPTADGKKIQEFLTSSIVSQLSETELYEVVTKWNAKPRSDTTIDLLEVLKEANVTVKLALHIKDIVTLDGMIDNEAFTNVTDANTVGGAGTEAVNLTNEVHLRDGSYNSNGSSFQDIMDFKVVYTLC